MNNENIFTQFKNTIRNIETNRTIKESEIQVLEKKSGLDYRSINTLLKIIQKDNVAEELLYMFTDPAYYTLPNMIKAYKNGFEDIIPYKFYENEDFVNTLNITKIPDNFLKGNRNIKQFNILPNITYIGNKAFEGCEQLAISILPGNITYIGHEAFKDCKSLRLMVLPPTVKYVGVGAFKNCSNLQKIVFPSNLHVIEEETFNDCESLTDITLNKTISVGKKAFSGCDALESLNTTFIKIEEEAFRNCVLLKTVKIATSYVAKRAFMGCKNLESITFETHCPDIIKEDAFVGCNKLKTIKMNDYMYNLYSIDGYDEILNNIEIIYDAIQGYKTTCEYYSSKTVTDTINKMINQ